MKALILKEQQRLELENIERPTPKNDEVLIRVAYCGVCGSDLARYFDGKVHNYPLVLGHEFSGVIEEVGKAVENIKVGDRVTVAPLLPQGNDDFIKRGEPALSSSYSFLGSRENGAMAEFVAVKAENVLVLPEGVSTREAALIEPLTVAIHGIERIQLTAGADVVVLGAGTIGIMTVLALKAKGVGKVTVIDINDEKLTFAKKIGADHVLNSKDEDLTAYFNQNNQPEVVIETAGVPITQVQAIDIVKKKGKVVYIGTAAGDVKLPAQSFEKILRGELEITGSWMSYSAPFPGYEWKAALTYIENGIIDVKPLIHEVYTLEDTSKPFDEMRNPDNNSIKFLYKIGE
ncbi:galactitol-1-phosphate 5-dehydrogenase [Priestia endophytica]